MSPPRITRAIRTQWARISAKIDAAALQTWGIAVIRPERGR
jgi:hypothetical protein